MQDVEDETDFPCPLYSSQRGRPIGLLFAAVNNDFISLGPNDTFIELMKHSKNVPI